MPDTNASVTTPDAERAAKSLEWLAFNWPADDDQPMCRAIHGYSTRGAEVIRTLVAERDRLLLENARLRRGRA